VAERPRRRRDDNEDDGERPKRRAGGAGGRTNRSAPMKRGAGAGAKANRGRGSDRRSGGEDRRTARRGDRTQTPPGTRRRVADDRNPTRSGIQYPSRRTARRDVEASPAPPARRPVLRTVKRAEEAGRGSQPQRSRRPAKRAPAGLRRRGRRTEAGEELARAAGSKAKTAEDQLARAADAFAAGREREAARILRPLRDAYPDVAAVRELLGLVHYRLGQYPAATKELLAFVDLTGSVEQHPVLMDCWRAQRRFDKVEALWEELASSSPSGALVTEGRIVLAGARADAGQLHEAISTLAKRADDIKRPQPFHLRLWYALADLYERAGEIPRAREYFGRVGAREPGFADVAERLAALG
jgi:tetratricopeptide (TPR) repeat protein